MIDDAINETTNYVDDNFSHVTDDTESVFSEVKVKPQRKRKINKLYEEIKSHDPNYHKISHLEKINPNDKTKTKTKTEFYSTSFIPGSYIRDAMTGSRTHYRVGSWHEDLFFKVRDASLINLSEPVSLYYDSPEQYERHFHVNVSTESKTVWTNKFAQARARLEAVNV